MILINKNNPPASFTTYSQTTLGVSFEDMDEEVKDDLKESLLAEQGWICGYCQQKIKSKERMKIEHHCEQSICNGKGGTVDRRLDYTNLMAVCEGKAGEVLHCDSKKAEFNSTNGLPIGISPWISAHMNGLKYHSTGLIDSSNLRHTSEIENILNLNSGHLKESRKNIWFEIFQLSKDGKGGFISNKLKRLTEYQCIIVGNKYPVAFPGVYKYMLDRFC